MAENSQENSQRAEHLRQYRWQKGQRSPNPGGRPKRRPITIAYQKLLSSQLPPEMLHDKHGRRLWPDGATWLDMVVKATVMQAASGDIRAMKEMREAIEGRLGQRSEVFREFLEEEPLDETQRAVMELDQVDRNLLAAASTKVLDMILEEAISMAEAGELEATVGIENTAGENGVKSTSVPDDASGQTNP